MGSRNYTIMKKYILLLPLTLFSYAVSLAQSHEAFESAPANPGLVNWMTFEQAVAKSKIQKKKIFIDVFTDWCGWCKVMDKNTFSEPQVAKILNEDFYPVKFNAEQREDIAFNGHTFKFISNGNSGVHQLAASLLNNQMSYPTVVFLDEEFRIIQPLPGYQKAPEFHKIIQFIGEDHYKSIKWDQWQTTYKSPYKAETGE